MGGRREARVSLAGAGAQRVLRGRALGPALILLACAACAGEPGGGLTCHVLRFTTPQPAANLVLIVNDAMRRDRLGAYGGPQDTPAFDGFAAGELRFDAAYTQSPWTKPSMATLFTGLYPSQHGALTHPQLTSRSDEPLEQPVLRNDLLGGDLVTLAEILRAAGWRTGAFVGNPWLEKRFGFDQGFELYDDSFATWDVPGAEISRAGLAWLEGLPPGDRFFLYLHYMDSHRPYGRLARAEVAARAAELAAAARRVQPGARKEIARHVWLDDGTAAVTAGVGPSPALLEMAYDRGVENFDGALAELLAGLEARPDWSQTAVVVTSDHGEALFTRGYGNHGTGLYDDEVAVPLAARLPGVSADAPIDCRVGLIDLLPTLCTYLGVQCPEPLFGLSWLAPASSGRELRDRPLVAEGVIYKLENRAIRDASHKLLWQPQRGPEGKLYALFDLVADPGETGDLLGAEHRTARSEEIFRALLAALRTAVPPYATPDGGSIPLDPETQQRLRDLGYLE